MRVLAATWKGDAARIYANAPSSVSGATLFSRHHFLLPVHSGVRITYA
jgi:hypothetical protein